VTALELERLRRSWAEHETIATQLATVDHKKIGTRYLVTAALFFLAGGSRRC
jgi:cytochrome c oxidase subunit I+III